MYRAVVSTFSKASPQQLTKWLAAFIFIFLATYISLTQSIELPKNDTGGLFDIQDYGLFLALALLSYFFRILRWLWMSFNMKLGIPVIQNSIIYISGFALSATPGHVAELAKVVFLKPFKVSTSQAISLIFNDRFLDLCAAALFACLIAFQLPKLGIALGVLIPILGLIMIAMQLLGKLNFHKKIAVLLNTLRAVHSPRIFSISLLLSVMSWGCQSTIFYIIVNQFITIDILICSGIYMVALSLGALSMMPGGIGTAEISIGGLLTLMGTDLTSASFIALFTRLFTFWPAITIGWLSLLFISIYSPNKAD